MRICVAGLWHLGTVISACLAEAGHEVVGLDFDTGTVERLSRGQPPLFEPGLMDLVRKQKALRFTTDASDALAAAEVVWIAYDTPVDDDDTADVDYVIDCATALFEHLADGTLVIVSSQLPVGSIRRLEEAYAHGRNVTFACHPENLRLGNAIESFMRPGRIVAGVRSPADRARIAAVFETITSDIEWMSVESAEMVKHALNAFLATSVAFINEIAVVCEAVGADAKAVERALKSDPRIGPRAYLSPGGAFAGGTLARDVTFLSAIRSLALISGVKTSNDLHRQWTHRKLQSVFGDLRGRVVAIWGLSYKAGTDTLRRSASVELCHWLASSGAVVRVHDPEVRSLPDDLAAVVRFCAGAEEAARDADAVVIATDWPEYRALAASILKRKGLVVIDANRFVAESVPQDDVRYFTVGKGIA